MKRESLVCVLGFVLILTPFLGIPSSWKRIVYVVLGIVFALVGYQLRRRAYLRSVEDEVGERKDDVYVEQVEQLFAGSGAPPDMPEISQETPEIRPRRGRAKRI